MCYIYSQWVTCIDRFAVCLKCEILIIDTWSEYIKKSDGVVICFSIVNLMLGCLLFKKFKKIKDSCSLPKAVKMSSTYLKFRFVKIIFIKPLRFVKTNEDVSKDRS